MGICLCCGKKGLFLKRTKKGLCLNCANGGYVKKIIDEIPLQIKELLYIDTNNEESSCINTSLDAFDYSTNGSIDIGYYPSYSTLTPGERNVFLNWLKGGAKGDVNIGYVFLYFYCLERRMEEKTFYINAKNELIRLMQTYKNTKFPNYAYRSLLIGSLKNDDMKTFGSCMVNGNWSFELLASLSRYIPEDDRNISAENIVKYYRNFNYSKSKVIEENSLELEKIIEDVFIRIYGQNNMPIFDENLIVPTSKFGNEYYNWFCNPSIKSKGILVCDFSPLMKDIIKGLLLFSVKVFRSKGKFSIDSINSDEDLLKICEEHEKSQDCKKQNMFVRDRPLNKMCSNYCDNFYITSIKGKNVEEGISLYEKKIKELKFEEQLLRINNEIDKAKETKKKWNIMFLNYQIYCLENGHPFSRENCKLTDKDKLMLENKTKKYLN